MPNLIVLGAQWGDEGKGKIVDLLAGKADVVVRFQGGANAGHTIVIGGEKTVLHQVPSGIMNPSCLNILGNGCVVDPVLLRDEIREIERRGIDISPQNLLIAGSAHLVTPVHKSIDRQEGGAIGTTGKGIGPCYTSKVARQGFRVEALIAMNFEAQLKEFVSRQSASLAEKDNLTGQWADFVNASRFLAPFVGDAQEAVWKAVSAGRNVLLEGAQGSLLDIDHGTYPFVTSSNTTIGGALTGTGVYLEFSRRIAVVKAFQTRVGNGPFPTELKDATGAHLRSVGAEFGATTGRPRRCGWLDLKLLRQACIANGFNFLALTKLDCLTGIDPIKIATDHDGNGRPVYREMAGWTRDISQERVFDNLPQTCRDYISFIETSLGIPAGLVSTGPDRDRTMIREPLW